MFRDGSPLFLLKVPIPWEPPGMGRMLREVCPEVLARSEESIWGGSLPLERTQARGAECAFGAALLASALSCFSPV